jgi:exosome complex RNA-binding protein Rrp4
LETTLLRKLGIKEGFRVALINASKDFSAELGPLPDGTNIVAASEKSLDFILIFAKSRAELSGKLVRLRANISQNGMIWVAWPKKSSGLATDLSFAVVQEAGLAAGVVDTKICAINEVWSGLRFVIRLKDRVTYELGSF